MNLNWETGKLAAIKFGLAELANTLISREFRKYIRKIRAINCGELRYFDANRVYVISDIAWDSFHLYAGKKGS